VGRRGQVQLSLLIQRTGGQSCAVEYEPPPAMEWAKVPMVRAWTTFQLEKVHVVLAVVTGTRHRTPYFRRI